MAAVWGWVGGGGGGGGWGVVCVWGVNGNYKKSKIYPIVRPRASQAKF